MKNKFLGTGDAGYHPVKKMRIIFSGLRFAVLYDFSVLYKVVMSALVLAAATWLHAWVDVALILLATGFALSAELFNTAIEAQCDFMETRHNEKIGIIKDIAAAATGIAIVVWWVVLILESMDLYYKW